MNKGVRAASCKHQREAWWELDFIRCSVEEHKGRGELASNTGKLGKSWGKAVGQEN